MKSSDTAAPAGGLETAKAERTLAAEAPKAVDPKVLEFLVCPVTKQTLIYDAKAGELISKAAGLAFPVRDGVPVMLPEEARRLDGGE